MTQNIKNRHRLKSKEIRDLVETLETEFEGAFFDNKSVVEVGDVEDKRFVFVDGKPVLMYVNENICLTIKGIEFFKVKNKYVTVDMGAVKFVTNGADVMAPGIVDADKNIKENDFVWICDERNKKPLAVGFALISGEYMIEGSSGKAVRIIHYVGDAIWGFVAKSL